MGMIYARIIVLRRFQYKEKWKEVQNEELKDNNELWGLDERMLMRQGSKPLLVMVDLPRKVSFVRNQRLSMSCNFQPCS